MKPTTCFHPLKSGRDWDAYIEGLKGTQEVSIPSSRVGTGLSARAGDGCLRFPSPQVGSGLVQAMRERAAIAVSIPSSRVGTRSRHPRGALLAWFPSPQVGSGPITCAFLFYYLKMFPSPQVGSGRISDARKRRRYPSFHPLKSGRDAAGSSVFVCVCGGFHPLKSGRDRRRNFYCFRFHTPFPSPQVGSGLHFWSPPALYYSDFHPLKSGRDKRLRKV